MLARDVNVELPFELADRGGESQHLVIERRPGGGIDEPVGPDPGQLAGRHLVDRGRGDAIGAEAIGVAVEDRPPRAVVPEVVAEVDPQDRPRRVDRRRGLDLAIPGEAVDELREAVAVGLELVLVVAGVGQVGQGEIADEPAVARVDLPKVVDDEPEDVELGDEPPGRRPRATRRSRPP